MRALDILASPDPEKINLLAAGERLSPWQNQIAKKPARQMKSSEKLPLVLRHGKPEIRLGYSSLEKLTFDSMTDSKTSIDFGI